jgi:peptidoglycan/xylan/chitin deacetylase (PgdA/CDA1 family)
MASTSPKRIPILAYHTLMADQRRSLPHGSSATHAVRLEAFHRQMSCLRADGWTTILPEDLCGKPIDSAKRQIVITFDDGHDSGALAAAGLHENGYRGIFYVPWSHIERPRFLTRRRILDLLAENFAIGSHGITHLTVKRKEAAGAASELALSKEHLEDLTGVTVVSALMSGCVEARPV